MLEGGLEGELEDGEDENPFHVDGPITHVGKGGLEGTLLHVLDLNGGGI